MRRLAVGAFPWVVLLLAPFILLSPVVVSGKALFWGTPALQFMPWREFVWDMLRSGQMPLWNPWLGMGAPLFANYQSALAYPFTWSQFILAWIGGIEWAAWWQGCLVVLHWVITAIGMARLAKGVGLGDLAQAVSGLAFGLGGYLVSRAGFLSINAAAAWLPWIVLYSGQISSARLRAGVSEKQVLLKLSFVTGLQLLAGHAQTAWYTFLLAGMWSGYWGWLDALHRSSEIGNQATSRSGTIRLRIVKTISAWMRLAIGYLVGAGIAAVQLLPTAEYLAVSQRATQIDFEYAMTYSYWPWRFLTLLAPDLFGNPVRGDYWGYANYWEDALYIGLLPLLLAVSAILGWVLRRPAYREATPGADREGNEGGDRVEAIPFLVVLLVLSFVLALGNNTLIFPWLYRHIPTFDMFQAPTRFTIWAAFAMALLAGFGAQKWRRPEKRALYWTRLGTAGAIAVMIGAGLTWYLMGDVSPSFIRAAALAGMWGVGAGVLSLLAPKADERLSNAPESLKEIPHRTGWQWAVGIFIAVDLIAAGWGLNPGIDVGFYSAEPNSAAQVREMLSGRRLYLSYLDEDALKYDRFLRFDSFDTGEDWAVMREVLLPNMNMFDQIASLSNFDPLVPGRYTSWMDVLSQASREELQVLLDVSGAGVVESVNATQAMGIAFTPLAEATGARARWVPCARNVADSEQALMLLRSESFNPDQEIILEGVPENGIGDCVGTTGAGQVVLETELPNSLVLRVQSDHAGWLLLSDSWYPGWRAFVDGVEVPIHRADYLFRSLSLTPGEHRVHFVYHPISLYSGLVLSIFACLVAACICYSIRRTHKQASH